jgi:hypothetical protein
MSESAKKMTKFIAFYLPQFHPIPENDRWWGKGFTEWTNVAKTNPLFPSHYQPHIPADLGFYDLRLEESRIAQAELAAEYGIQGFCYYHYWFQGKRLLERPFNEVLHSGKPDFPFCLCWANETWSRRWLGEERDILMKQTYSAEGDLNHVRSLLPAFADLRNIRIEDRPVFLVYRPNDLPDPRRTTDTFRRECVQSGLPEPYLIGINAHWPHTDQRQTGFDDSLSFQPQLGALPGFLKDGRSLTRLKTNLRQGIYSSLLKVCDYAEAVSLMSDRKKDFPELPSVFVGWDNTPRRGRDGIIMTDSNPDIFENILRRAVGDIRNRPSAQRLVFINAWNEWAEGNHLEPDQKFGRGFLEAVKRAASLEQIEGKERAS